MQRYLCERPGWHQLVSASVSSLCAILCRCKRVLEWWLLRSVKLQLWTFQRLLCVSSRIQWDVLWNEYVVLEQTCMYVYSCGVPFIPDVSPCRSNTVFAALWQCNLLQRRISCVQWIHWDLFVPTSLHRAVLRGCSGWVWESRVLGLAVVAAV